MLALVRADDESNSLNTYLKSIDGLKMYSKHQTTTTSPTYTSAPTSTTITISAPTSTTISASTSTTISASTIYPTTTSSIYISAPTTTTTMISAPTTTATISPLIIFIILFCFMFIAILVIFYFLIKFYKSFKNLNASSLETKIESPSEFESKHSILNENF